MSDEQPKLNKPTATEKKLALRKAEISLNRAERVATEATNVLDPVAFEQLRKVAADLIAGGASSADADTPEKLLVKLQAGFELGMTPVQAQNSLYIVNGRVTLWGSALIARLRKFGWSVAFQDESAESSTIVVRKGDEMLADTFNYQDAVDSGYTQSSRGEKVGWRKGQNRKLKLRYGAAAQLAKTYLPEVLGSAVGVAEIDQDAPAINGGVGIGQDTAERIQAASTPQELQDIVQSLPVSERKAAVDVATDRAKQLQEAA